MTACHYLFTFQASSDFINKYLKCLKCNMLRFFNHSKKKYFCKMHLKNILSNFKIIGRAASNASHWQSEARPCAELDGLSLGGVCHLRGLAPSLLSSGRLHHRDEQYCLCDFFSPIS